MRGSTSQRQSRLIFTVGRQTRSCSTFASVSWSTCICIDSLQSRSVVVGHATPISAFQKSVESGSKSDNVSRITPNLPKIFSCIL